MKLRFVILLLLTSLAETQTATKGTFTQYGITTADGARTYAVYKPVATCTALFVFLHGTLVDNQFNSQPYALKTQLEAIADGAASQNQPTPCILWPLAIENTATGTHYWGGADGVCATFLPQACPDDIDFIAEVVQLIQNQYGILPSMTLISGMSSGGYMTQTFCDHDSALVSFCAPTSGAQYIQPSGYQFASPILSNPLYILRSNGTADPVVPGCGGSKTFWNKTMAYSPSMDADFGYWTQQDVTNILPSQTLCTNGQPTPGLAGLTATNGINGTAVQFVWQWTYSGHQWPPNWELTIWGTFTNH